MTRTIAAAAEKVARPGTTIRAVESAFGPASIEGGYDDAFAVPGLLERIKEGEAEGADAHVIACFDDTGLDAARALAARRWSASARPASMRPPLRIASPWSPRSRAPCRCWRTICCAMALTVAAPACAPPTCRCSNWTIRPRTHVHGSAARSRTRSMRTAPRRSCSVAPAWPTSPPRSSANSAFRSSTGSRPPSCWPKDLRHWAQDLKRGGFARPMPKDYRACSRLFRPGVRCLARALQFVPRAFLLPIYGQAMPNARARHGRGQPAAGKGALRDGTLLETGSGPTGGNEKISLFCCRPARGRSAGGTISAASAQSVVRIGMTAADIPKTVGQPDQGFEGNRFTGNTMYEGLTTWDLSSADKASVVIPGVATEWASRRPIRPNGSSSFAPA